MKKRWIIALLALTMAFGVIFASCGKKEENPSPFTSSDSTLPSIEDCKIIEVIANSSDVTLLESAALNYDYTVFFTVYGDGKKCETKSEYIDSSAVKAEVGTYKVYCTVKGESAQITVHVNSSAPVSVTALSKEISIYDDEISDYDFASLFRVSLDGVTVELENKDIDLGTLKTQRGTYVVSCTYKGKKASVKVTVSEAAYLAELAAEQVKIHVSQVETFNFGEYFAVSRNGSAYSVTNDMLEGEVKKQAGEYTLAFTRRSVALTLTVIVSEADIYQAVSSYASLQIPLISASSRDYTKDFYLYKNGISEEVLSSMIDTSALNGAKVGDTCLIKLTVADESAELSVKIIEDDVIIAVINGEAFVNGAVPDLASLFKVTKAGKPVAVTYDMISGEPNYSEVGEYQITLNYEGRTATATVTVKNGVIINYASESEITVRKGTKKETYDFSADFKVSVNGVEFTDLSSYFVGLDDVDFNVEGEYDVTLKLKFNDKQIGLSGAQYTYPEKTITYKVVKNVYELSANQKEVEVKKGAAFNELSNVTLVLNGVAQKLTTDSSAANGYTSCYVRVVKGVNANAEGRQTVRLAVYANGVDDSPAYIEYDAIVNAELEITAESRVIFAGTSLYLPDLFTVTDDGKNRLVSLDMISGSFDPYAVGTYELTLTYKEVSKTAKVTVIESDVVGVYKTAQLTIGSAAEYDEEGLVYKDAEKSQQIGDMVISSDMQISVNGKTATNVTSADDNSFGLTLERSKFVLTHNSGVAYIVYDNYLRMQLTNYTMPLVYFNESVWTIKDSFVINSAKSGKHVLELESSCYSIDLFQVESVKTGELKWFGIKTYLYSHLESDYDYKITFGEATMSEGFEKAVGASGSVTLGGETCKFMMSSAGKASVDVSDTEGSYEGSFSGIIDGKNATLSVSARTGVTLTIGGTLAVSLGYYDLSGLGYNASDFAARTYTLHGAKIVSTDKAKGTQSVSYTADLRSALKSICDTDEQKVEVYPFSYKFALDLESRSFELISKDKFFGLYQNEAKTKFIMLSGYGAGIANFDMTSYAKTAFSYEIRSGAAVLTYLGESLLNGEGATLALGADGNTITVLSSSGGATAGEVFESVSLNGGAIVKVNSFVLKKGSTKADFLNGITVITEDGELTAAQKESAVKTNTIAFNAVGFYQFYVTVTVGGENKNLYYGVQVIDKKYEGKTVVREYERSFSGESTLLIDEYGYVSIVIRGETYNGNAVISEDGNSFNASVKSASGNAYTLSGSVTDDLLYVESAGSANFSEHYAFRTTEFAGNGDLVLRAVKRADDSFDYYASSSRTVIGEKVSVTFISGEAFEKDAQIKITYSSGKTVTVKISELGNETSGLTIIG